MGLNADGSGVHESASLQGVVLKSWLAGTIQFDAGRGQAWMFEADSGENFNGWKLLGSCFLGYQMPLPLEVAGILLETEQNLGYVRELSPLSSGGWGSDFFLLTLSPVLSFRLSKHSTLAALFQFRRQRMYTPDTVFYAYYANRKYAGTYWDFYRIAVSYSLEL